jgi:hypothetical protein
MSALRIQAWHKIVETVILLTKIDLFIWGNFFKSYIKTACELFE